jgi:hypothetical protein
MKAFKCDRCKEYSELKWHEDGPSEIPRVFCPHKLSDNPMHLCGACGTELREIITEWCEIPVYPPLLLIASSESLIIVNNSNDRDSDDDHTSVWGGAGPDCIIERLEAA